MRTLLALLLIMGLPAWGAPADPARDRIASVFVSEDFINEQLAAHSKSELVRQMKVELDHASGRILLRGLLQVPVEELRAVNLDPALGLFRFQVAIKPEMTRTGYLILDFPLDETYFYPAASKDPRHERVIVPVQLLSLALASARGYMAALSGDFSGFDRRTAKLKALIAGLDRSIALEKNADALDDLRNQREALRLQLEAVPIERKQLQGASKEVGHMLAFTGENELNINHELGARKNALILKIKLSQLAPFLKDLDLGGVRVLHDKLDGGGQNYLAIDVNSPSELKGASPIVVKPAPRIAGMKVAPALIMRLNQSLFESEAVFDAEKKEMGSKIEDLVMRLQDDGLHVAGKWHAFFITIPFDTAVDFVTTGQDVFEARVRRLDVAGIDLEFLSGVILESMKKRLDKALRGICDFKYVGEEKDRSRALQVTVKPSGLVPAFPDLHLVDIDVREREFLLKVGRL